MTMILVLKNENDKEGTFKIFDNESDIKDFISDSFIKNHVAAIVLYDDDGNIEKMTYSEFLEMIKEN